MFFADVGNEAAYLAVFGPISRSAQIPDIESVQRKFAISTGDFSKQQIAAAGTTVITVKPEIPATSSAIGLAIDPLITAICIRQIGFENFSASIRRSMIP